jgi:hypothetical protein
VITKDQIIPAADVTEDKTIPSHWPPMINQTPSIIRESGLDKAVHSLAANTGYLCDNLNLQATEKAGFHLLLCIQKSQW